MTAERLDRILAPRSRHLLERLRHLRHQLADPVRARLDRRDAKVGESAEETVSDERSDRVVDRPVTGRERLERRVAERLHLGRLAPVGRVAVVAGLARVIGDQHAGLVDPRPERVVDRVGGRATEVGTDDGSGPHHDHSGARGERPLDLGHGLVGVEQRDVGRREDAPLVVDAPVLGGPAVERPEHGVREIGVVLHRLLHADGKRREHEAGLHVLGVHDLHAGRGVAVAGVDRLQLAERRSDVVAAALAPEVVVEHARLGDGIEQRVRDEPVEAAVDHEARLPADGHPLHAALRELRFDVTGEGVRRLVVVVVGVEQLEVDRGHPWPPVR